MGEAINKYAFKAFRFLLSRRVAFRGRSPRSDGRITLVTVDFNVTSDVVRLIRSFRKFVEPGGRVVVVQNGSTGDNRLLRNLGAVKVVNRGFNLGHGLGLDWGMRQVSSEYTLICDPDTAFIGPGFRECMIDYINRFGAIGVDNGCAFYHPICVGFRTELWKTRPFSFEQQWHRSPGFDVGGALTLALGGLKTDALLPRTRTAGKQLPSTRPDTFHGYGDVFGDVFTNTYCASRKIAEGNRTDFEGWSRTELDAFHDAWRSWISAVIEGSATVKDFPGEHCEIRKSPLASRPLSAELIPSVP